MKLLKLLSNKIFLTLISFLLQVALFVVIILYFSQTIWVYVVSNVISILVAVFIINKDANPGYKMAWVFPILAAPLFGGILYIFLGQTHMPRRLKKRFNKVTADTAEMLKVSPTERPDTSEDETKLANFVINESGFPVYANTETTYFRLGEDYAEALIRELDKAEKFIFIEFFIIEFGSFWDKVLAILLQKVAAGVDVRLIYDDIGTIFHLPHSYYKKLNKMGIKTQLFNQVKPTADLRLNNRTHRKIVVIDGDTAFTGGINIGDEYTNEIVRFGHWKDTGIMLKGPASWSFTVMFLSFWNMAKNEKKADKEEPEDYAKFMPDFNVTENITLGLVQPISSGPHQSTQMTQNCFLNIINNADKYVYINTPYLVLDNETLTALCLAAKSGVDVRILMPGIPDKKTTYIISRSFYPVLIKSGVKIYEYKPGFNHAKSVVCDDQCAYIGTCNMDYRSFYLHYECGALLYGTPTVLEMKQDYMDTLQSCHEVTLEEASKARLFTRILRSFLRIFAPLF